LKNKNDLKRMAWALSAILFPAFIPKLCKKAKVFPVNQG